MPKWKGWLDTTEGDVIDGSGGNLTDNFVVRGDGGSSIDIGNIFMSSDGNSLTVPSNIALSTINTNISVNASGTEIVMEVQNAGDILSILMENAASADKFQIGYNDTTNVSFITSVEDPLTVQTGGVDQDLTLTSTGNIIITSDNLGSTVGSDVVFSVQSIGGSTDSGFEVRNSSGTQVCQFMYDQTGDQSFINSNGTFEIRDPLRVTGDITPQADDLYALGTGALRYTGIFTSSFFNYIGPLEFVSPNGTLLTFNTSASESDINLISPSVTGFGKVNFIPSTGGVQASITFDEANDEFDMVSQGILGLSAVESTGIVKSAGADTGHVLALVNIGTNGGDSNIYLTSRDPVNISAEAGSILIRSGATPELWFHSASGTSTVHERIALVPVGSSGVTTSDTLTNNSLILGNGTTDIDAAESGNSSIRVNGGRNQLQITPEATGTGSVLIFNNNQVEKLELYYDNNTNTAHLESVQDFTFNSTDGALNFSAEGTNDDINMDAADGGFQFTAANDINIEAVTADFLLSATATALNLVAGTDITLAAGDDVLLTNSGTATLRFEGLNSSVNHNVNEGYVIRARRTTGACGIDFDCLPQDGTSPGLFRFGINSGSTGANSILLAQPNGVSVQTQFSTSANDSWINAFGGALAIGKNSVDTNFLLDIETTGSDIVGLYSAKAVTIEADNGPNGSSTDIFLNKGDVGFNQSEFRISNENDNTDTMRYLSMNYTSATQGGLSIRFDGAVAVGIDENDTADSVFHVRSNGADTVAIQTLESTGTNGGITQKGVGDQDPNGVRTGSGGDEHIVDAGALSGSFESLEATTGTTWLKRSLNQPTTIEIHNSAQFEALDVGATGTITVANGETLHLRVHVSFATVTDFDIQTGATFSITMFNASTIQYATTGTFLTIGNVGVVFNQCRFASYTGGTLLNYTVAFGRAAVFNQGVISGFLMGSLNLVSTAKVGGVLILRGTLVLDYISSLNANDSDILFTDVVLAHILIPTSSNQPFINYVHHTQDRPVLTITGMTGNILSGESVVKIDAGLSGTPGILLDGNTIFLEGTASIFDTSGIAATAFTSVGDKTLGPTAVTSVSGAGTGARFFHTAATSTPLVGSTVIHTGFTDTDYNGSFKVTSADEINDHYNIETITFAATDTGTFDVNGVTVGSSTHGLSNGDGITIVTDDVTDYDGHYVIYNSQLNAFDITAVFTDDLEGTWSTEGLDQKDVNVLSFDSPGSLDSKYIATSFVNANTTANPTIVNGVFGDMAFGTVGNALIPGSTMERMRLVGEVNGRHKYAGIEPFDGRITMDITEESSGGTQPFRFKIMKTASSTLTASTIAFVDSNPDTITDSGNGFLTAGFAAEDTINISGSTSNDGDYTIATVTAGTITLVAPDSLTVEAAGASVTIGGLFTNLETPVEAEAQVGSNSKSLSKTYPLKLFNGEEWIPQSTRDTGSSGFVATYATFYATQ